MLPTQLNPDTMSKPSAAPKVKEFKKRFFTPQPLVILSNDLTYSISPHAFVPSTADGSGFTALLSNKSGYQPRLVCVVLLVILPLLTECFILEVDFGLENSAAQKEELPWREKEFHITTLYVEYTKGLKRMG